MLNHRCRVVLVGEDDSRDEARQELNRLRVNLGEPDGDQDTPRAAAGDGGIGAPAPVPAVVPELPPKMMWTNDVRVQTDLG